MKNDAVNKSAAVDYLEWASIILLGAMLLLGAVYLIRRVRKAERRADRADGRVDEADRRADEAITLAREAKCDLAMFKTALIAELGDAEDEQLRKPTLHVVKNVFGVVTTMVSGTWAAARASQVPGGAATTVASAKAVGVTGLVALAATGGIGYAVYAMPATDQRPPPAATAAAGPPRVPRGRALPALSVPTTTPADIIGEPTSPSPDTTTDTSTVTPTTTTTTPPRTTTPRTPSPTATGTSAATSSAPTPTVAVTSTAPVDAAPKAPADDETGHVGAIQVTTTPRPSIPILEATTSARPPSRVPCLHLDSILDICAR